MNDDAKQLGIIAAWLAERWGFERIPLECWEDAAELLERLTK